MIQQRTIRNKIHARGIGLHGGKPVSMTLSPAAVNTGIVFRKHLCGQYANIPVLPDSVVSTSLATTIADCEGNSVATTEHLLAAMSGVGIDNCIVDIDGDEVPAMDGSAAPFVFLLESAGIERQASARQYLKIKRVVEVKSGDAWVRVEPYSGLAVEVSIDFDHPFITAGIKRVCLDFSSESFKHQVARARTFAFLKDVDSMRRCGRALGGSLENAIVIGDAGVMNDGGLRYADELVRHKALDAVGDLYQLGKRLIGKFSGYKSGHGLNHQLVRAIMECPANYEITHGNSSHVQSYQRDAA